MQAVDANFEHGGFARFANRIVNFLLGFFDHLFDAGGMDASVENELFERNSRYFPAHRVKTGEDDRFRRVVNDEVNARRRFQRADVSALTADDAALHVVIGQRHDRNRGLGHMIRGATLNRKGYDVARALVRFFLGFAFDVP